MYTRAGTFFPGNQHRHEPENLFSTMPRSSFLLLVVLLASAAAGQPAWHLDPSAAARTMRETPGLKIVDLRPAEQYAESHLPGAISLPYRDSSFRRRLSAIAKTTPLLLYGKHSDDGRKATERIRALGYRKAFSMEGGINWWAQWERPLEGPRRGVGMTLAEYDSLLRSNEVVLVDFGADWCGYCPDVNRSATAIAAANKDALKLIAIDADLHPGLCKALGVEAFPTVLLYQTRRLVWRQVGWASRTDIERKVRQGLREYLPTVAPRNKPKQAVEWDQ
ncbi:MAG: hypothetical protein EOO16_12615 [Chitinophagaceae bacterium]|nr:MAG: hypothetical protein EOO16_12615 [Chitinophagaceae bacterium]